MPTAKPALPSSVRTATLADEYQLHELLGRSAAFEVRRATSRGSGQPRAVKLLHLDNFVLTPRGDPTAELLSEIEILRALQGAPGVVQLLDHVWQPKPQVLAAVFELLPGGELFDRIERHGPCTEPEAAQIARQVGGALAHMHARRIVHRDIKPDNLAFASVEGAIQVKLIDFGFAAALPEEPPGKLRGLVGTMDYAAPEVVSWYADAGDGASGEAGTPYDQGIDLWSFGVTLYIALCGFPPFFAEGDGVIRLIKAGAFSFPAEMEGLPTAWPSISPEAKALLRSLLAVAPARRLDAHGLQADPWVQTVADLRIVPAAQRRESWSHTLPVSPRRDAARSLLSSDAPRAPPAGADERDAQRDTPSTPATVPADDGSSDGRASPLKSREELNVWSKATTSFTAAFNDSVASACVFPRPSRAAPPAAAEPKAAEPKSFGNPFAKLLCARHVEPRDKTRPAPPNLCLQHMFGIGGSRGAAPFPIPRWPRPFPIRRPATAPSQFTAEAQAPGPAPRAP